MPSVPATSHRSEAFDPATVVIAAGVCAALHVGKLPPAIAALQQAMGVSLLQAGFLLSGVQAAGMLFGAVFGLLAEGLGLRFSMLLGLLMLAGASGAGALAGSVTALMILRAAEGFGFLLVVLPAPALLRQLVPPQLVSRMMGVWGAYMPLATALALLCGPLVIAGVGWRGWWALLAGLSAAMALVLARVVPVSVMVSPAAASKLSKGWPARLVQTLSAPGPWLVALTFAVYSSQWLAVVGFLPTIYLQAGVSGAATGALTALAAAVNIVGNVAAGRLLHRGVPAPRLLVIGFLAMALAAAGTFAGVDSDGTGAGLLPALRYASVLAFSALGGLIPATLFALAVRLAPGEGLLSTTVGWMQQWSSFGQFAGPPVVAWVASAAGGWHLTWLVTGGCSLAGGLLTLALAARLRADMPGAQ